MVIIKFQKDNFLNLTRPSSGLFNNGKFSWRILGNLVVNGGLPRNNNTYDLDLQELFMFVEQVDPFSIRGFEVSRKRRKRHKQMLFADLTIPPISGWLDSVDHQYYKQLLFLRNQLEFNQEKLSLKKEILSLELDLRLQPQQKLLVNVSQRFVKPKNLRLSKKKFFVEKDLNRNRENDLFSKKFPKYLSVYESSDFKGAKIKKLRRFKKLKKMSRWLLRRFDPFFYYLSYNKFFFSLTQNLNILRNRLKDLKISRLNLSYTSTEYFLQKKLNILNVYFSNLYIYDKKHKVNQLELLKMYPTSQFIRNLPVFDFGSTAQHVDNLNYIYFRNYQRGLHVPYSNRLYFKSLTEGLTDFNAIKQVRDQQEKIEVSARKASGEIIKSKYAHSSILAASRTNHKQEIDKTFIDLSKFDTYRTGLYNTLLSISTSRFAIKRFSLFSRVSNSNTYGTYSPIKKRRVFLKDSMLAHQFYKIRKEVFNLLLDKNLKPLKRIKLRDRNSLSRILFSFMNNETKYTEYVRSDFVSYNSFEKRLHNLLIVQGVLFEYWEVDSQLATPSQLTNVMVGNINTSLEINRFIDYKSIPSASEASFVGTLKRVYKFFLPIFKIPKNKILNYLLKNKKDNFFYSILVLFGECYFMLKSGILLFIMFSYRKTKIFLKFIFKLLVFLYPAFRKALRSLITDSPSFIRFTNIVSIWNSTYVAEEGLHDLEGDEEPWNEDVIDDDEHDGMLYQFDGFDIEEEEVYDTEKISLSTELYKRKNFFHGIVDYADDFEDLDDEFTDFVVVDIPHYLSFVFTPVIDFFVRYPLWSFIDLFTSIYTGMSEHYSERYINFLQLKKSDNYKFLKIRQVLLVFTRWLFQFIFGLAFFLFCIISFDYTDMQTLIVYTFNIPFRDFYYVSYVMVIFVSTLYLFGPLTFREFVRDELGFDNLSFIFTSTLFASPELYDPLTRPFKLTKDFSNYHGKGYTKIPFSGYFSEKYYGDLTKTPEYLSSSNDTYEHLNSDSQEFYLLNHKWVPKQATNDNIFNKRGNLLVPSYLNEKRRLDLHIANPSNWNQNKIADFTTSTIYDSKARMGNFYFSRRRAIPYQIDNEVQRKFVKTNVTQSSPFIDD